MILGLEIGLVIFGLIALIRGKLTISKTKVVVGWPARLLGLLALTPIPVVLVVGVLFVLIKNPVNPEKFAEDNKLTLGLMEAGIVIFITVLVFGIGAALAVNPEEVRRKKKRRRDEDDDYEDDDEYEDARPRKRSRRDEEEDEYEDRPRKRSRRSDDEDDDDRDTDRRGRYR